MIHVDPRFTRTSAMATKHVGIRAGADIAFLGGIVHHILEHNLWFEEYVKRYTNAPVIVDEAFLDTEDLDGFFSGWDAENRRTMSIANLGGATLDNEENYLIKKLLTALGVVQVENQARI